MTTTINASTTAGLVQTADTSGVLALQTAGTTAVSISASQVVTLTNALAEASGGTGTTIGYNGFKNRIINGAMVIDQRNAGASVSNTTAAIYTLDRWGCYGPSASKFTVQQSSTAPAGFNNSLLVTSSAATAVGASDIYHLFQQVEGLNVSDLGWGTASAQTITLSFQVRSSLTGTFGGSLRNSAGNRSYPFTYTISTANTWETKSIAIAGDTTGTWLTTNGIGISLSIGLGVGSTFSGTAGAWAGANYLSATGATSVVGTSGATFYITGVQLEKGSTATSFDYRPYGTELALCQRYFEKSFEIGTAPASAGSAAGAFEFAQQVAASAQQYGPSCKYAVVKRSTPTATFYNWNAAGNQAVNVVTGGNTTSLALRAGQSGTSSFSITFIAPAGTSVGQGLSVQWTADSEL